MLRWLSRTPLASPLVPELKHMKAVESAEYDDESVVGSAAVHLSSLICFVRFAKWPPHSLELPLKTTVRGRAAAVLLACCSFDTRLSRVSTISGLAKARA